MFAVAEGPASVTQYLLQKKFDHIFFTGSERVGKIIAETAAKTLTPISLELGGKSPSIVNKDVGNLKVAAKRIVWSKWLNAGQTCIATDYVLVHEDIHDKFVAEVVEVIKKFSGTENFKDSPNLARIISPQHVERLVRLLANTKGKVVIGGDYDAKERFFAPTVVTEVPHEGGV